MDDPGEPLIGQSARLAQARLICEHAAPWPHPVQLLSGDMNVSAANDVITRFAAAGWVDTWAETGAAPNPGDTYHGFEGDACTVHTGKIDWIFRQGACRTTAAEIVVDTVDGRFPSDHYFLLADLEIQEPLEKLP